MKWLHKLLVLAVVLGTTAVASAALAQSVSPSPSSSPSVSPAPAGDKAALSFPIPDLGNCADMGSCLTYCQDPVHQTSCIAYAKDKGFYKEDIVMAAPDTFWAKAKTALGCDSRQACEAICSQADNENKCHEFAVKQKLIGGYVVDPQKEAVLAAAKNALGCDGAKACLDFCADPAHADSCDGFAKKVGLRGGQEPIGPGGCISGETCKAYCSDPGNYSECSKFVPPDTSFHGPGGCASQQECRSYCEANPDKCRTYAPGSSGVYVPVACPSGQNLGPDGVCTAPELTEKAGACDQAGEFWNGTSCEKTAPAGITFTDGTAFFEAREDMGGCKTPAECYDYCDSNRDSCPGFNPQERAKPPETYIPNVYVTPGTPVKFAPNEDLAVALRRALAMTIVSPMLTPAAALTPNHPGR